MSRVVVSVAGRRWEFEPGQDVLIGRDPACSVVVDDPRVSRMHLRLHHDAARGWVLEDNGSTGGMYINGEKAAKVVLTRPATFRLSNPADGVEVLIEPAAAAPATPGSAPTVLTPGQPAAVPMVAPAARPAARTSHVANVLGLILFVAGCVAAVVGTVGSFMAFGVDGGGASKAYRFLTELAPALGWGAIAVAAGTYLRLDAHT